MKKFTIPTAKNLETGETRVIDIDPRHYTSVHDWKPTTPETFTMLLGAYQLEPKNTDEFGNGLMRTKALNLDPTATAVIYYSVKEEDSPVASPVLMSVMYGNGKQVLFASLVYGHQADPERKLG